MSGLGEFELIARYFTRPTRERRGVGDDCALIDVGGCTLALTSDMLLEAVHFFPGADARDLGHKALAVNLSDLAAAGARPRCFLLDLALPAPDPDWLEAFSSGLFALAREQDCTLIGGDTSRSPAGPCAGGPIVVAITAVGEVAAGAWRGRDGARPGDDIWVSGALGEAAFALAARRALRSEPAGLGDEAQWRQRVAQFADDPASGLQHCLQRLDRPAPRVPLGLALAGLASAAIDVSDGLLGDLGHILERSQVGAEVDAAALPCGRIPPVLPAGLRQRLALAGGDDYELLFCAPPRQRAAVAALSTAQVPLTRIGRVTVEQGLRVVNGGRDACGATLQPFDHFRSRT